ncbi:class I SAM-dependent methyltransferase [Candidatus Pacearchaeota archaeon]|nr:class I SAM-dependent methyltransferase [Candidatus Pacearchaeota archaeon]
MKNIIIQKNELGNIKASLDYISKFNLDKKSKILDIGANYGSLIFNLYNEGYKNVFGVDINRESIKLGKQKYKKIKFNLMEYNGKKLPFKDNSSNVILMFDVIEHITNIQEFLEKEVYRVLKKGGIFIFQTPNKYINVPWEIIHSRSLRYREYHCSLQTYWSLKKLLNTSGFKSVKIEKHDIYTEHNIKKVNKYMGVFGIFILKLMLKNPIFLYPNFYGWCKK